jgi:hypothetical protein
VGRTPRWLRLPVGSGGGGGPGGRRGGRCGGRIVLLSLPGCQHLPETCSHLPFACSPYPRDAPLHNRCKVWPQRQLFLHCADCSHWIPGASQIQQVDIIVCDSKNKLIQLDTGVKRIGYDNRRIRCFEFFDNSGQGDSPSMFSARCLLPVAKANFRKASCLHVDDPKRDDEADTGPSAVVTRILGLGPLFTLEGL